LYKYAETPDDVIIECRKLALRRVTIARGSIYTIRSNFKTGKLVISKRRKKCKEREKG
jgi:hypothetical protein